MNLFDLTGKVAVVTGGSRGIGYMIAGGLIQAGARVYLVARKQDEVMTAAAKLGDHAIALTGDLSTQDGCAAVAGQIAAAETELHALFNNAGAAWGAPLEEFPDHGWDKVLNLNVKGIFHLTIGLLPLLRAGSRDHDPARVINIGSIDGLRVPAPGFNNFSYSASKAAVHMLTRHLARELAPGILVNAIAPGPFESKMIEPILTARGDQIRAMNPLGRIGEPADMAGIAIFLASAASAYITGAVIPVDGGVSTLA